MVRACRWDEALRDTPDYLPAGCLTINLRKLREAHCQSAGFTRWTMFTQTYGIFMAHADASTSQVKKAIAFLDGKLQGPPSALAQPGADHVPKWVTGCIAEAEALYDLCDVMLGARRRRCWVALSCNHAGMVYLLELEKKCAVWKDAGCAPPSSPFAGVELERAGMSPYKAERTSEVRCVESCQAIRPRPG